MTADDSIEVLDLRHFPAAALQPLLESESALWMERLSWDFRNSVRLLKQYLDSHMLPGYAALEQGHIMGYTFCVYEETKAVVGDVFALPGGGPQAHAMEQKLLTHLLETLQCSPQVDRIESQLLLHPAGLHSELFRQAEFDLYHRLYMMQPLAGRAHHAPVQLPAGLTLRPWQEGDLTPAARLIAEAYRDHPDSLINDQYRTVHGSLRFLNNIVRYAGCGTFAQQASYVITEPHGSELAALVLSSRVSQQCGHITQICVHPAHRRKGLARTLLTLAAASFLQQDAQAISLTVTESNTQAIDLYRSEGYAGTHVFDAAVWQRTPLRW